MPLKIQIISDLHLEFMKKLPKFLKNFKQADYLFLAGDIGYIQYPHYNRGIFYQFICWCTNNYKKVFYIMGNHDAYTTDLNLAKESLKKISEEKPNFIFLEKGVVSELEGYKVIGCTLWSHIDSDTYSIMNDKNNIKINGQYLERNDFLKMHKDDIAWLNEQIDCNTPTGLLGTKSNLERNTPVGLLGTKSNLERNTIVMTHHLPSYKLIHQEYQKIEYEKYNSAYASECDELVYKAKLWIYGHTHKASDVVFDGITRCICNPYGYYNDDDATSGFTIKSFDI
jgi:predicted phosphodiesterase